MDLNSIKVGTVGRFHIRHISAWNPTTGEETANEYDVSGVVVMYRENYDDFFVINELGKQQTFKKKELISVSSIRIGKEVRSQFAFIAKKYEEIRKLEEEKSKIESLLYSIRNQVKTEQEKLTHIAGYYSSREVDNMICEYGFRISATRKEGDSTFIMLQQSDSGTRYSKPNVSDEFPFVYQEYDGCCLLREEYAPKAYKAYLNKNAPKIIPALAKLAKNVEQSADVGDKYIYANTNYWICLKDGYTKKNIDTIIKAIKG